MGFIDADAHVDECADTWSYFPSSMSDARPAEMNFADGQQPDYLGSRRQGLFIDGHIFERRLHESSHTTVDTRELYDVKARLKHMDELGVEIQTVFPSTLLEEVTRRPELEIAICESYNRWLADRCADGEGRLRWNAILPLRSIPDALKEMRRAKEDGAVGIFKRAFECDERRAGDPYFFPAYQLAEELDLPICMHVSSPYTGTTPFISKTEPAIPRALWVQDAFISILVSGVWKRFPRLRFSFVEAASGWLPYALFYACTEKRSAVYQGGNLNESEYAAILEEARLYVTCEAVENLPDIIARVGNDNLCVGTDYSHGDRSSVLMAHRLISERTDIDQESISKLTVENGRRLYGL